MNGDGLKALVALEVELDAALPQLALARIPVRAVLATAHGVFHSLVHGDLLNEKPPIPGKAEAFGGRVFGLAPVLYACPPTLGGSIADALNAYAEADPDQAQLRLLIGFGHFSELMPEVHKRRWLVSGDRGSGFRLDHPPDFARYEARDFLLLQLVTPFAPPPPPLHEHQMDVIAAAAPDLAAVDELVTPLVLAMREYYKRFLVEERLLSDDAFRIATGYERDDWLTLRASLWSSAMLSNAIVAELYASHRRGEIDENRLWEASEWTSLCWDWNRFVGLHALITDLAPDVVEGLLGPFVLDCRPGHESGVMADGFMPPIARIEGAAVTSGDFMRTFSLERNILYVLNRTEPDRFASLVSEHLEPQLLEDAADVFRAVPGWEVVSNVNWSDGELDLLVYCATENVAAHVQAKAALAPQGARMVRQIEARTEEGLRQLRRLREIDDHERDVLFSKALGKKVSDVEVVDVLLSRSCFGTARVWAQAGKAALVNLGLLRLLLRRAAADTAFAPSIRALPTSCAQVLDDFEREADAAWAHQRVELADTSIEVPMLDFRDDVVRAYRNAAS